MNLCDWESEVLFAAFTMIGGIFTMFFKFMTKKAELESSRDSHSEIEKAKKTIEKALLKKIAKSKKRPKPKK